MGKMIKKWMKGALALLLTLSAVTVGNISIVEAADNEENGYPVSEYTPKYNDTVTVDRWDGDHKVGLPSLPAAKEFTFTADVKIENSDNDQESVALMFGINANGENFANVHAQGEHFAQAWGYSAGNWGDANHLYLNSAKDTITNVNEKFRMSLNVVKAGDVYKLTYSLSTLDEDGNITNTSSVDGDLVNYTGGTFGLMTHHTKAVFSNITLVTNDNTYKYGSYEKTANNEFVVNGVNGNAHLVMSNPDVTAKAFVYEADVKLAEGSRSAALIYGLKNKDNPSEAWIGANFDFAPDSNNARIFTVGGDVIGGGEYTNLSSKLDKNEKIHMRLEVKTDGTSALTLYNEGKEDESITVNANLVNYTGGGLGILTFDSSATFSNVTLSVNDTDINNNINFTTNLVDKSGSWFVDKNGLRGKIDVEADAILFSDSSADDFVYEADVKFNENKGAASLIMRAQSDSLDNKEFYVANINGESGECRIFKFYHSAATGNTEVLDLAKSANATLTANGEYHLKVTAIGKHFVYYVNGELIINTADYTLNNGLAAADNSHFGQNDAYLSGKLGLMTWSGNVTYQNVKYTEITDTNTPQFSDLTLSTDVANGVDMQIDFMKGQYAYIGYVKNNVSSVALNITKTSNTVVTVKDSNGNSYEIDNLPITKVGENLFTVTSSNGHAKVVYKVQIHKQQPEENYYNEDYRGQYHYSVKDGWANDPNGMVYFNGKYHLFHQFYDDTNWGPMHWAHVTSTDLIHWDIEPIALYPDEYGSMYSGCAVVADATSAPSIFNGNEKGIVLLITANGTNGKDGQRVTLAYSKDGENWEKLEDKKVVLDWTEDTFKDPAFRDPKVFRYDNKWFMVIAGGRLRIYSSDDLVNWSLESAYEHLHTECPDLYPVSMMDGNNKVVKWVLDRGGRYYKIGDFKVVGGKYRFVPDDEYVAPWYKDSDPNPEDRTTNYKGELDHEGGNAVMNFGKDSYAAMTYYLTDFGTSTSVNTPRIIGINWMNTWDDYCNLVDDASRNNVFNGTFNLQLEYSLGKNADGTYVLKQTPISEYTTLRDTANAVEIDKSIGEGTTVVENFDQSSYEIVANIKPSTATKEVGFNVRVGNGQKTVIKYNFETETISMDRSKSGAIASSKFAEINSQSNVVKNADGSIDLHIYVDRASVEVFTNDYTVCGAQQIFPDATSNGLEMFSVGGSATVKATVYPLNTIWDNTPISPIAIGTTTDKVNAYVGVEKTISAWVSPVTFEQNLNIVSNNDKVEAIFEDGKIVITASEKGTATLTVTSPDYPSLSKTITVIVRENNFETNIEKLNEGTGTWYIDDTQYIGSHDGNAFLLSDDKVGGKDVTIEADVTFANSGIVNLIFNAQTTNPYDGCYAVQLRDNKTARLFDFYLDHTFIDDQPYTDLGNDGVYNVKITYKNNVIEVYIEGEKCITYDVSGSGRVYTDGYVGFGIWNTTSSIANFYVTNENWSSVADDVVKENYTEASYGTYATAFENVVTVLADKSSSEKDVLDAKKALKTAKDALVDITTLKQLVKDAADVNLADYTDASAKAFEKALEDAQKAMVNGTDESVKAAEDAILATYRALVNIVSLDKVISEVASVDTSKYTEASAKAFINAYNAACKARVEGTTEEVEAAEKALVDAYNALEEYETYKIVEGMNANWTTGSGKDLVFKANGDFTKFVCVEIDDKVLDKKHYTAKAGSTIVTISEEYLSTLSVGEHKLTVVYRNGEASCTFTVRKVNAGSTGGSNTGDTTNVGGLLAMLIASMAILLGKRKRA